MSVIYLWAIHLLPPNDNRTKESCALTKALRLLSTALSDANDHHSLKVIHTIQAEVLLAYYLYTCGRFAEGRCHVSAAVALCVSFRIHQIGSSVSSSSEIKPPLVLTTSDGSSPLVLLPTATSIEQGERIRGWWNVYVLDKSWSAVLGLPSTLADNLHIDTPWPLDADVYEQVHSSFGLPLCLNSAD